MSQNPRPVCRNKTACTTPVSRSQRERTCASLSRNTNRNLFASQGAHYARHVDILRWRGGMSNPPPQFPYSRENLRRHRRRLCKPQATTTTATTSTNNHASGAGSRVTHAAHASRRPLTVQDSARTAIYSGTPCAHPRRPSTASTARRVSELFVPSVRASSNRNSLAIVTVFSRQPRIRLKKKEKNILIIVGGTRGPTGFFDFLHQGTEWLPVRGDRGDGNRPNIATQSSTGIN